jgi:hypothetical protein
MRLLRSLSTTRLVALAAIVVAFSGVVAVLAVAAVGSNGDAPPPKPLPNAVHDALVAPAPEGLTARVTFTNRLFPSGALLGAAGPVLMSGGSGRLWMTGDGRGRLELQSNAGDAQLVWTATDVTLYDASSDTAYHASLPSRTDEAAGAAGTPPSVARISDLIAELGAHATLSAAEPGTVASRPAYSVSVSPKHDGGLLGSVELAWDAEHGVPLRIAVSAQGSTTPALELVATSIAYGPVSASNVDVRPPATAKVVDLGGLGPHQAGPADHKAVTGIDAVRAAVSFPVTAPERLVGLPRRDVRLTGGTDAGSQAAVITYGQGLGAVVVVERATATGGSGSGAVSGLPTIALDGTSAHELATQLGTIVTWNRKGVSTVLAGSVPAAAAEAAARELG